MTIYASVGNASLEFNAFGHETSEQGGSFEGYDFEDIKGYEVDLVLFNGFDVTNKINEKWMEAIRQELIAKD